MVRPDFTNTGEVAPAIAALMVTSKVELVVVAVPDILSPVEPRVSVNPGEASTVMGPSIPLSN